MRVIWEWYIIGKVIVLVNDSLFVDSISKKKHFFYIFLFLFLEFEKEPIKD